MTILLLAIFLGLAAIAAAFACWPILRQGSRAKGLLAGAVAMLVFAIGIGVYLMLGSPGLALRTLQGPRDNDLRGLIAQLSVRVRQSPNNAQGWMLLGRGYLTLGDGGDAAAAFKRALAVAPSDARPAILSAYGEALTLASAGAVTPAAEQAFNEVLKANPKDQAARYFLGLAYASRRDNAKAIAIWESLLADTPGNAAWRTALVDRLAALKMQGGAAPDISAMVAGLAARLKRQPDDPQGWQRLIRAYVVLGDNGKARAALADARVAMKDNVSALVALDAEAAELKLQK